MGLRRLVHQQLSAEAVDRVRNGEPLDTAASGQDSDAGPGYGSNSVSGKRLLDDQTVGSLRLDDQTPGGCLPFYHRASLKSVYALARHLHLWMRSLVRRRAKAHTRSIDELVHNFSVRSAACVCEADRAPVERNTVEMLKTQGQLARDGGHEEGMDMFGQLVRERLPPALHIRYCYRDALAVGIVLLGEAFDSVASGLHACEPLRVVAPRVCCWIFWHAAGATLLLLLLSTLSKQRLTLDGFCDGSTLSVFVLQ